MKIDRATKMSILYDYYGQLLTDKQRRIFTLYHEDNLSLSEIGDELNVSKQGIHDALKKAEAALLEFEDKLELAGNSRRNEEVLGEVNDILEELSESGKIDPKVQKDIEDNLDKLVL